MFNVIYYIVFFCIYILDLVAVNPEVIAGLLSQQFLPSNSSKIQKGR